MFAVIASQLCPGVLRRFLSRSRWRRGHTLLQLVAALAIVAVLAALALPAYQGSRLRAYLGEVRQIASAWKKEAASYYLRTGSWQGATDPTTGWAFPPARWWTFLQTVYGPDAYPSEAWFRANLRPGLVNFASLPPELQNLPDYVLVLPMDGRAPLECGRALQRTCGARNVGNPGNGGNDPGDDQPPPSPLNLRILAVSYTTITVAWDDVPNENRYIVRWWKPGNQANPSSSGDLAANTTSYQIQELTPDTTYEIRVTAYNDNGGTDSNTIQATTLAGPEVTLLTKATSGFTQSVVIFRVLRNSDVRYICHVDPPGDIGVMPFALSPSQIVTSSVSHHLRIVNHPSCGQTGQDLYTDTPHNGVEFVVNPASDWVGVSQYFPLSGFRSVGRFRRSNIQGSVEGELAPLSTAPVVALAVGQDGTVTYYYGEDRTIRTTPLHQHVATLPEALYSADYSHTTGRLVWVGGSSNRVFVGPLQGPWTQIPLPPNTYPRSVRWHTDGQRIWLVTWGPTRLWLLEPDGTVVHSTSPPNTEPVLAAVGLTWQ